MTITSVSNATIIVNSAPIFVALLAYLVFKEKPSKGIHGYLFLLLTLVYWT
jgi:drug/metabolite transporter (DMT)-like permease